MKISYTLEGFPTFIDHLLESNLIERFLYYRLNVPKWFLQSTIVFEYFFSSPIDYDVNMLLLDRTIIRGNNSRHLNFFFFISSLTI